MHVHLDLKTHVKDNNKYNNCYNIIYYPVLVPKLVLTQGASFDLFPSLLYQVVFVHPSYFLKMIDLVLLVHAVQLKISQKSLHFIADFFENLLRFF